MNWSFFAHIVRDLFDNRENTILYCYNKELQAVMFSPEHSIGSIILHTERDFMDAKRNCYYWEIGINNPYLEYGKSDLIISVNYNPNIFEKKTQNAAVQIRDLLKKGGKVFAVNPGVWASNLKDVMKIDNETIVEAKRYSMLSNEEVFVYENI